MAGQRPRSLRAALEEGGSLSKSELELAQRAFDVVGDIAIVDIPEALLPKARAFGEALLSLYPNVKVVARKASAVRGELRTRSLEVIAGERRTVTEHHENGVRLRVDVENVYFSPRLSSERLRIARLVKPAENVIVLFAGVGPYSVTIAKLQPSARVVSVELNPEATPFVLENISLNKVAGRVEAIEGDARSVVREARFRGWADRIVMVLPERAHEFLEDSLAALKPGGIVHIYGFGSSKAGDQYAQLLKEIARACAAAGRKFEVLRKGECGTYAPGVARIVIDFTAG